MTHDKKRRQPFGDWFYENVVTNSRVQDAAMGLVAFLALVDMVLAIIVFVQIWNA